MSRTTLEQSAWKDCEASASLRSRRTFGSDLEFVEYAGGAIDWFLLRLGTFDGPDPDWDDLLDGLAEMQRKLAGDTDEHRIQCWRAGTAAGEELQPYRESPFPSELPYQIGLVASLAKSLLLSRYEEAEQRAEHAASGFWGS